MTGVQRRDTEQLLAHATAAFEIARTTGSDVIGRKLHGLRAHLKPFVPDARIGELNEQITSLTGRPAA